MNDKINGCNPATGGYKEVVTCSVDRIYDSCYDKDCLEDLPVYFTDCSQKIVDEATSVKFKRCEIAKVLISTEAVPYNSGLYTVDITFYFRCWFEVFHYSGGRPFCLEGLVVYNKKVILYGSEGDSMIFSSQYADDCDDRTRFSTNLPKAMVETVDPIPLSARIIDICDNHHQHFFSDLGATIPESLARTFDGDFTCCRPERIILCTIGLFSIISLARRVSLIVPACGFGVPLKECISAADDPCKLFNKIQFPTDQFFPPKMQDSMQMGTSCSLK
jgi:hypothetical protein